MKRVICGLLLAAVVSWPATGQVYKVVDEKGRVTYTDSPPPKDQKHEKVELKSLNTQPAIEPVPSLEVRQEANRAEEAVNYSVSLASPTDGAQVPPGQRDLIVAARVNPPLRQGHGLQFIMNGEPLTEPSQNMSVVIEEIYRGEHAISARVVNERGRVLAQSDSVTVYVHRPSINSRRNVN